MERREIFNLFELVVLKIYEEKNRDVVLGLIYSFFSSSYMDYVSEMLEGDCTVHHAPWAGDGGSLDTSYILQCLPMFLSSSFYEPVHYDAIIFNSGLHDVDCCDFHSEVTEKFTSFASMQNSKKVNYFSAFNTYRVAVVKVW